MSTFVEIAPDEYDPAAFKGFEPSAAGFDIANARALMWLSQLAYETHRMPTAPRGRYFVWDYSVANRTGHVRSILSIYSKALTPLAAGAP